MNAPGCMFVRFVPVRAGAESGANAARPIAAVFLGAESAPAGVVRRIRNGGAAVAPAAASARWDYLPAGAAGPVLASDISEHHLCSQVAEFYLAPA